MLKHATVLLVLLVPALAGLSFAQDETLLGDDVQSGGYGAVLVKFGKMNDKDGVFVGGQGGWVINHTLVIGGGGYGLANQIAVEECYCPYLGFGYGGFLVEYIISSHKLVHGSAQLLIGGGGVSSYGGSCSYDDWWYEEDSFFALEPAAHLMLNLHKYVRVGFGASYRYISGVDYKELTDSDLSGFTLSLIAKFGVF